MSIEQEEADGSAEACRVAPTAEQLPVNTCATCGALKPGEAVFECTICTKILCVRHLDARLHQCYTGYL